MENYRLLVLARLQREIQNLQDDRATYINCLKTQNFTHVKDYSKIKALKKQVKFLKKTTLGVDWKILGKIEKMVITKNGKFPFAN